MKKLIITLAIILSVVIGLLLVTPYFIKRAILKYAQNEVSENLDADLKISNFYLNIFDFPNSDIKLENVTIISRDSLEKIPVLDIPLLEASINIKLFLLEEKISVKKIFFKEAKFNPNSITGNDINCTVSLNGSVENSVLKISDSDILLNDLKLDLLGEISETDRGFNIDLSLHTPNTEFESLLALLPEEYKENLKDIKTKGTFSLKVEATGECYLGHFPRFKASFLVNDATIQYPELAESINKINADIVINNNGGPIDSTNIYVNKAGFTLSDNPFSITGKVLNISNPIISCDVDGIIDLGKLNKVIPLEDITLKGVVTTDIKFDGKYSDIEQGEYGKIVANGTIKLNNLYFKNSDFPEGILLKSGNLVITPSRLNLNRVVAKHISSDLSLTGHITNYLPLIFKEKISENKPPKVDFDLSVSNLDIKSMYESFDIIKKVLPFAHSCRGEISSRLIFKATLDKDMNPVMSTINGKGYFASKGIIIDDNPFLAQLSTVLKSKDLSRVSISELKVNFSVKDNIIKVEPFTTKLAGNSSTIFGTQTISGLLDYTISINILRSSFGGDIDKILKSIPSIDNIKDVDIDIKIGGTIEKPTYKTDLSKAIDKVTKEFMKDPKKGILEGLSNFFR